MQIALQPIIPRDSDAIPIEKELRHWFFDVVYQPIYDLIDLDISRQNYIGIS